MSGVLGLGCPVVSVWEGCSSSECRRIIWQALCPSLYSPYCVLANSTCTGWNCDGIVPTYPKRCQIVDRMRSRAEKQVTFTNEREPSKQVVWLLLVSAVLVCVAISQSLFASFVLQSCSSLLSCTTICQSLFASFANLLYVNSCVS